MLSACTTGTDGASGAACAVWVALRSSLLADVAPSHACADSLMYLESSVAVRRRRSRSSCPAGPGMRQAHHLRRMPMGGIGGIFNLFLYSQVDTWSTPAGHPVYTCSTPTGYRKKITVDSVWNFDRFFYRNPSECAPETHTWIDSTSIGCALESTCASTPLVL